MKIMKKLCALLGVVMLYSCGVFSGDYQNLYEVRLVSGESIYTSTQPKQDNEGYYRFNDVNNQHYAVKDDTILFIEPAKFKR